MPYKRGSSRRYEENPVQTTIPGEKPDWLVVLTPLPKCDMCGAKLRALEGRYGPYLSCRVSCGGSKRYKLQYLANRNGWIVLDTDKMHSDLRCDLCNKQMVWRVGKATGAGFLSCTGFPECTQRRNPRKRDWTDFEA